MDYVQKLDAITFGEQVPNPGEVARSSLWAAPGFCLSADAYRVFLSDSFVDKTIAGILSGLEVDDPEDLDVRSEQIRNFLDAQQLPADIAGELLQAYYELSVEVGSGDAPIPVAVRPSPAGRDQSGPVCPEPPEAFLNVRGEADLLEHVKRCWGSLWTARAISHRLKQSVVHSRVAVAVVVQAVVPTQAPMSLSRSRGH